MRHYAVRNALFNCLTSGMDVKVLEPQMDTHFARMPGTGNITRRADIGLSFVGEP